MAGGPSTVELAAAVSEAGGLGFLAAGYRTADAVREEIGALRGRSSAPFGVNVFVPRSDPVDEASLAEYVERLREFGELGEPRWDDDQWEAKLGVLADERVPVVSFTFALPSAEELERLRGAGSELWMTVTSVAEARAAVERGFDALVLQGVEAGGHRASFSDDDDAEGLSTLALLRLVASETDLPLVAAGGIADGPGVAAVLAAGAAAAQIGSAFMLAPEAATNPAHREALSEEAPTALTRAFSGRTARGIVNRFMRDHEEAAPVAYPQVHHLTSPLRAAARERGDRDGFNLWAGQTHRLARAEPAAEIVERLSREARESLECAERHFGYATPEAAARGDIPEQYCIVLGVRVDGDEATVWLLTNDRPRFEPYEVVCVRSGGGWEADVGTGGFSTRTPPEILEKAARLEAAFRD
jgi:nitronate monooxygenase